MSTRVFLLIDTDIWKRLVSKTEYSNQLKDLNYWVTQRNVTLMVPDVLISEWEKHREIEKAAIETALKGHKEEARLRKIFKDFSAEFTQQRIDEIRQSLRSQLDTIDQLVQAKGLKMETPPALHALISAQRKAGKRPFWNRTKDHTNDAELIFTTLNYLNDQQEFELYFLSGNINEFAKMPESILHPEITDHFPTVVTHFFTEFADIYEPFERLDIPRRITDFDRKVGKVQNTIYVDRSKPILDQVHEYLTKRFQRLNFLPKELFAIHYPFATSAVFPYHGNPFTLVTDNHDVYDLLTKIKIEGGEITQGGEYVQTPEDETKVKEVFKWLLHNLIESIAYKDKSEVPIVYSEHSYSCLCTICTYKRLQFQKLLTIKIDNGKNKDSKFCNIQSQLKLAYGQYKIGRFIEAARICQELFKNYTGPKDLTYYILAFNLRHIAPFIRRDYWEDATIRKFADELMTIDLDKIFAECNHNHEDHQILEYIHKIEFISRPFKKMQEKVDVITDHFHGQNTGWNTNVRRLREQYFTAEAFLHQNCIMYDMFGDYDKLVAQYAQGMLASYGNNPMMGGKLIHFNDLLLEKLLLAANAEDIQKFLNRYKLKEIEYYQTATEENTLAGKVEYLLENHQQLVTLFNSGNNLNKRYFWDNYSNIIYNALTLLAMLKLEPDVINRVAEKSLTLLEEEGELFYFKLLKHFRFFLYRKQHFLTPEILQEFYKAALRSKQFHTDNFFEVVVGILNERKIKVQLSNEEFQLVRTLFLEKGEHLQTNAWFSIGNIFSSIADNEQKEEIRKFVRKALTDNFDAGQYYLATMFEMITPQPEFQEKYFREVEDIIAKGQQKRLFVNKEYYTDNRIDNLLNYCLHFNIPIPANIISRVPDMGAYYKWLNDPEQFNYDHFNTDWLYNHFTISFKRSFRKSQKLKEHLLHLIKTDPDTEIERIFIMIYCYDD